MPAMSKRVLERYRVRRLTEAESKACKVDRVRRRRMVNLAAEMERWRELKRQKNLPSDAAVAKFLLDAYMSIERQQHVSLRGSSSEGAGEIAAAAEPDSHSAEHIEEEEPDKLGAVCLGEDPARPPELGAVCLGEDPARPPELGAVCLGEDPARPPELGAVCLGEDPARPPELGAVCLGEEMEKHTGPPARSTEQKLCQSLTTGDKRRPYHCSLCEKSFWAPGKLKIHHRVHSGETPYLCAVCGKSFSQAGSLKRHEHVHVHTGETHREKHNGQNSHQLLRTEDRRRPYPCSLCEKSFWAPGKLQTHHRVHSGETPYLCAVCGKSFSQAGTLKRHERVHTGETPHHCPECGKGFKYGGDLNRHKRTHTGEKPNLCPECGRGFSEAGSLKAHRRIHSGEKPYQCKVCAKHFRFLINLHTHQRRHTCRPSRIR